VRISLYAISSSGKNLQENKFMEPKYLLLSVEDRVATVTINRPDKGNSLSPQVLE